MRPRRAIAATFLLSAAAFALSWSTPKAKAKPELRIGYSAFPPYYVVRPDGSAAGFAVDMLAEAARRAGYRVLWVPYRGSPEAALSRGVEVFPMLAILPERRAQLDYSAAWWENALVVVSPAAAPVRSRADSMGKRISLIHASFGLQRMKALFPEAVPMATTDYREVVSNVCRGRAQAAIMESRLANSLQFLDECRGQQLTMKWFPELNLTYGVAVKKGQQALADELFTEITRMSADGTMTRIGQPWGVTASNQHNALETLVAAERSRRFWLGGFGASALALVGLAVIAGKLRKATAVAREVLMARSQFVANVSHEIRTPLHGILGTAGLLAESQLDESQQEKLTVIRDCGELLLRQINDLLDMAKLEAGKMATERIAYSPREVAAATVHLHEALARKKGVALDARVDAPETVLGDPHRVQQIINNLVSNALKFTSQGSVTLEVSATPGRLRYAVRDTGVGLTEEAKQRLFQPFAQADSSTARRFGGTGLGLTISRQLVELMKGTMGLESKEGAGSEFWFELPLEAAPVAPAQPAAETRPKTRLAPAHVLVAEDNPVNQRIMLATLSKLGCTAVVVEDGRGVVDAARDGAFDVILMDCHMPEMDGFEATRRIRKLPGPAAATPIIAVTAAAFEEDSQLARAAGMDDFLAKPFTVPKLEGILSRWVGKAA